MSSRSTVFAWSLPASYSDSTFRRPRGHAFFIHARRAVILADGDVLEVGKGKTRTEQKKGNGRHSDLQAAGRLSCVLEQDALK